MSYDIQDAWIYQKAVTDFDFERLSLGELPLKGWVSYFPVHFRGVFRDARLNRCQERLAFAFGSTCLKRLAEVLEVAQDTVRCAMDHAEYDALSAFEYGQSLDPFCSHYGLIGTDDPAKVLIESLDAFGPPAGFSESEICAALGLWLLGEIAASEDSQSAEEVEQWAEAEAILMLAEAEWHRGRAEAFREKKSELRNRNRKAAERRHAVTNKRKADAQRWYGAHGQHLATKAAAAEEIAKRHNCAYEVAKRWVTNFSRDIAAKS